MTNLKALAIPACSLINNISINEDDGQQSSSSYKKPNTFKPQVMSNLALSYDTNSTSSDSTEFASYLTRQVRLSKEDESEICRTGSGLDAIVCACTNIEELEIVDTGFNSAFSRLINNQDQYFWLVFLLSFAFYTIVITSVCI